MTTDAPRSELLRLINGFQASQAIHVAAAFGLADLLKNGPRSAANLAESTKTHPVALYRLMRALASLGVFDEDDGGRFSLTMVGEFLRTDVAGTHAPMAQFVGRPNVWQTWSHLLFAVRTGAVAFDHLHGDGVWTYRARHPEEGNIFDRVMTAGTERFAEAVMDVCDFGRFRHIVDVGGGDGIFLAKILVSNSETRGTLFDQPHVVRRDAMRLRFPEFVDRYESIGGNFFTSVPAGADAYLLKWILHDWDDAASIEILRSCRRAMKPTSRLLVVEHVIGPPNSAPEGKFMDLTMMLMNGGRERTTEEFAMLFAEAGFRLTCATPTAATISLLQGTLDGV
jgi:hypothetical protein